MPSCAARRSSRPASCTRRRRPPSARWPSISPTSSSSPSRSSRRSRRASRSRGCTRRARRGGATTTSCARSWRSMPRPAAGAPTASAIWRRSRRWCWRRTSTARSTRSSWSSRSSGASRRSSAAWTPRSTRSTALRGLRGRRGHGGGHLLHGGDLLRFQPCAGRVRAPGRSRRRRARGVRGGARGRGVPVRGEGDRGAPEEPRAARLRASTTRGSRRASAGSPSWCRGATRSSRRAAVCSRRSTAMPTARRARAARAGAADAGRRAAPQPAETPWSPRRPTPGRLRAAAADAADARCTPTARRQRWLGCAGSRSQLRLLGGGAAASRAAGSPAHVRRPWRSRTRWLHDHARRCARRRRCAPTSRAPCGCWSRSSTRRRSRCSSKVTEAAPDLTAAHIDLGIA